MPRYDESILDYSGRPIPDDSERLRDAEDIIDALTEALEWYREQADAAARHSIKVSPEALTAIVQVLALDAGSRADAALSLAKGKTSDV